MEVKVVAPQDGVLAWLLRDFENAEYISSIEDAYGAPVVILPESIPQDAWGTGYIGQDFTISRTWDLDSLYLIDLPALWTQSRARTPWTSADRVVLWLRSDVYQGLPQDEQVG